MAEQQRHNILVLDDDAGLQALCSRILTRAGHTVLTATSPETAAQHLSVQKGAQGAVDLLVIDYQLGGPVTGLDFFRDLCQRGVAPPAILVTGFADEGRVLEALRVGVRDVVRKTGDFLETLPVTVDRVLQQVTAERKALEADALRESEQRLRLALETGGMGAWEYDVTNRDLQCSAICLSHFGLQSSEKPHYQELLDLTHPNDRERIRQIFKTIAKVGGEGEAEFRVLPKGMPQRWLVARAKLIRGRSGRGPRLSGVTLDLTSHKLAEEELRRAKEVAEASAEQARAFAAEANAANLAKDEFLAVLSHELRTPLTPVLTTAQDLARDPALPPAVRESMAMIRRNVELEARLIDDLLDLTRISRGKLALTKTQIDLHEAIRDVIGICEGDTQGKGQHVNVQLDARNCVVLADGARLHQILWNLVKNAVKFTPSGGSIWIQTSDAPGRRDDAAGPDQGHRRVRLTVRDTGIGITPELLPKVFDAFEQGEKAVTRKFGGLGLGLAITRALVELHEGEIKATSAGRDQGATFTVEFPAVRSIDVTMTKPDKGTAPPDTTPENRGLSILLVEDHPDTSMALARFLRAIGHEVRVADTVAAAVREVQAQTFDLLISDIGLPDGSGLDLMRQLRAGHQLRGVVLSGFGTEDDVRRSREAGFDVHLTKPVSLDMLEQAINEQGSKGPVEPAAAS